MDIDQLRTLIEVVDTGTFEQAARALGVTAPAVSQRIKSLERQAGQVLVERSVPARPTGPGQEVLRFARHVVELHQATLGSLGAGSQDRTTLRVAVNADSLATWFTRVIEDVAEWDDAVLRIQVEDQDHSHALLRSGEVQAAVTASSQPVAGCRSIPLGAMEYRPVMTPGLRSRFSIDGKVDFTRCPMVIYNQKDDFQHHQLRGLSLPRQPPVHEVPSSEGYVRAVASGLGWGMVPTFQLARGGTIGAGRLSELRELDPVWVPLFLQRWSLPLPGLDRFEQAVRKAAAALNSGRR